MDAISRLELVTPDFGLANELLVVTAWLAKSGDSVTHGEPLVEITANDVTIGVSAPASGTLRQLCVEEDTVVTAGDVLAQIDLEET